MAVMRLSQRANYLDSGSEVEVADIKNYSTAFQIIDFGGLNDLRQTVENIHFDHDQVDLDLCCAYYHYHVGCIFNLYYFNNFDYSRYFFDYHFSGHFVDSDHLLFDFDDHPFYFRPPHHWFCFQNYQNTERLNQK